MFDRLKQERQRAREERIRHTNEQIARIKQRQRETERESERWNQLQPYILTAATVAVALVDYFVYQYFTWYIVDQLTAIISNLLSVWVDVVLWTEWCIH